MSAPGADEYQELLLRSYQTLTFGEVFFHAWADGESDPARCEKLRLIEQIVGRTAARLHPFIPPSAPEPQTELLPAAAGRSAAQQGWDDAIKGLHEINAQVLGTFIRCREAAPDPHHPVFVQLVGHALAITAFTDLEVFGLGDVSLAVLDRYLKDNP
ncbi:MAG TPA: hypothetical protein VFR41_15675 [Acidimicrobiia bacterium]|nr:hypothetical protein [Acidimicrobiia bacterium]